MNYIEDFNSFSLLNTQSPIRSTQKTKLIDNECNIYRYNLVFLNSPSTFIQSIDENDKKINNTYENKNSFKDEKVSIKQDIESCNWSDDEILEFLRLYKLYGKNFQIISEKFQKKTKEQIRHYYYRLITKIITLLVKYGYIEDSSNLKQPDVLN